MPVQKVRLRPVRKNAWTRYGAASGFFLRLQCGASLAVIESKHFAQCGIWLTLGQCAPLIRNSCPGMTIASPMRDIASRIIPNVRCSHSRQGRMFSFPRYPQIKTKRVATTSRSARQSNAIAARMVRGRAVADQQRTPVQASGRIPGGLAEQSTPNSLTSPQIVGQRASKGIAVWPRAKRGTNRCDRHITGKAPRPRSLPW